MSGRKPRASYVAAAQERARLRGWWGMTCGLMMFAIGLALEIYYLGALVDWHSQLSHPDEARAALRGPIKELWMVLAFPSIIPFMAVGGIMLNTVIWLIPPLRRISEKPGKIDASLSFGPMQKGLFQGFIWTWWMILMGVALAWLAP